MVEELVEMWVLTGFANEYFGTGNLLEDGSVQFGLKSDLVDLFLSKFKAGHPVHALRKPARPKSKLPGWVEFDEDRILASFIPPVRMLTLEKMIDLETGAQPVGVYPDDTVFLFRICSIGLTEERQEWWKEGNHSPLEDMQDMADKMSGQIGRQDDPFTTWWKQKSWFRQKVWLYRLSYALTGSRRQALFRTMAPKRLKRYLWARTFKEKGLW